MPSAHDAVRVEMVNVPSLLVTVRIALPMFASTRKAAPHAVPWRNVTASLVWRGPQKDGVVSLFARRHRPVMAVINAVERLVSLSGAHVPAMKVAIWLARFTPSSTY